MRNLIIGRNKTQLVRLSEFQNTPFVEGYKYLGLELDNKLNLLIQVKRIKVNSLKRAIVIVPKLHDMTI
jgi:hypothetical protein